ncbi:unnamed protein product [Pleuronectes platessa]|uniref:Transmembrane protein 14A n=2 Tax=Pleuronectes platessa TaxID=8262 RepID=A0A9N7VVV3_PLEPL|nr:unnamed protein product [Pleuronectes platessa]
MCAFSLEELVLSPPTGGHSGSLFQQVTSSVLELLLAAARGTRKCSDRSKVLLSCCCCFYSSLVMDWIGFCYAAAIALGGFMGYKRKGSVMSLMAGLVFGGLSAYGAYNVSNDPKDIKVSLIASGLLAVIMGMRYKKSGKLLPAGIMSGLSLLMVFRLLLLIMA